MKWIGQHIWDLVSRFRQHTYFEDNITLSTGKSITMDEYTSGTISITKIQDSGTSFNDNDTSLMTAAAIADIANRPTGQLQFTYHNFTDDIDTTKIYLSLGDADAESTTTNMPIKQPFCAPLAGKLMRVYFRCNQNLSASGGGSNCTLSWRLETVATGNGIGTTPSVIGTVSGVGPTTTALATYDFTAVTNTIAAGDMVWLSVQSDSATPNVKWFVTCLWEWDMSTIG